jgi:uncharacterized protein YbdZ (MbtH family)
MMNPFDAEDDEFMVLVNGDIQYSLWPGFKDVPLGWKAIGPKGRRQECLQWIEENWTDMRPRSLVLAIEAQEKRHGMAS